MDYFVGLNMVESNTDECGGEENQHNHGPLYSARFSFGFNIPVLTVTDLICDICGQSRKTCADADRQ
jgi:hypothetical protein